jgi:3D (Asp-Asp-Asp) domain-containing protein
VKKLFVTLVVTLSLALGTANFASAASNTYTVKSGDTLYKIAKSHKTSVQNIKSWNSLKSDTIYPKQKLKVTAPAKKAATTAAAKKPAAPAKKPAAPAKPAAQKPSSNQVKKTLTVSASAFTANCKGCSGITYTGINLKKNPHMKVISVDPKVIPLGSKVYVPGYGTAIAADKGSAIKGNRIDVFMPNYNDAIKWGRKTVTIQILK